MAVSFTSTSASSLRMNSFVFSSNSAINFESNKLPLPLQRLLPRRSMRLVCAQKNNRKFVSKRPSRQGIWSIRDDLRIPPTSFYAEGVRAEAPQIDMQEFQNVVGQLFERRIIRCVGPVDDDMGNLIVAQLLQLDAMDPDKDIILYINSPGGSVTAGMAIFDTMNHVRPDIATVCIGLAASMGAFLLSAGTKGKRYSYPSSRIMIHQPLGGSQGSGSEVDVQTDEMLFHKANLSGHMMRHTGQSWLKINEDTERDFFMSAQESKEYGLIDHIIMNPKKALFLQPAASA